MRRAQPRLFAPLCRYRSFGQPVESRRCFERALQLSPSFGMARSNLDILDADARGRVQQLEELREKSASSPDDPTVLSSLGNALKDSGMLTEAVATYRRALAISPEYALVHGNLAATFLEQGDFAPAIASFERALQLEPRFPVALTNFGKALVLCPSPNLSRAIEMYKRALEIEPTYLDALLSLGNVQVRSDSVFAAR